MSVNKKTDQIHLIDRLLGMTQTIKWKGGKVLKAFNEHDAFIIDTEKKLDSATPREAKKILEDLKTKKAELKRTQRKNLFKTTILALFIGALLTCLLIFIPPLFMTMTLTYHIIQGLLIAYVWIQALALIHSGVGNKLNHLNKVIAKAEARVRAPEIELPTRPKQRHPAHLQPVSV